MMKVRLENVKVRTAKDEMELRFWNQWHRWVLARSKWISRP